MIVTDFVMYALFWSLEVGIEVLKQYMYAADFSGNVQTGNITLKRSANNDWC